jgi:hypothetical protein
LVAIRSPSGGGRRKLEALVYKLYGLTEDEIAIVEEATK